MEPVQKNGDLASLLGRLKRGPSPTLLSQENLSRDTPLWGEMYRSAAPLQRMVNAGPGMSIQTDSARLKQTDRGPLVLLFYDGYELKAREGAAGQLYSAARGTARYLYRRLRRVQLYTGFYVAFQAFKRGLESVGCDVRVNDFATARAMPDYPIGVAGYPSAIDYVDLPNPKIFGPGDYGPPEAAPALIAKRNYQILTQPSPWFRDYYEPDGQGRTQVCFAGIDTEKWPDFSNEAKDNDVLIYDKIRWHRERLVADVLDRFKALLDARGLTHHTISYKAHSYGEFRRWLKRSRAMAFICEYETQGLACEEAMATNIPIFAWDEGVLIDPRMRPMPPGLQTRTMPYADERVGVTFKLPEMETSFDDFWARRRTFKPRAYVEENISLPHAGARYLSLYASLVPHPAARTAAVPAL